MSEQGLAAGVRLKNTVFAYLSTSKFPIDDAKSIGIGDGDNVRNRIANARATYFCQDAPRRKDGCGGHHVDGILAPRCSECEKYAWNIWKNKQKAK